MYINLIQKARSGEPLTSEQEASLRTVLHTAMFKRLGRETKISRRGYSIVLSDPAAPRCDMPSEPQRAIAFLEKAGIPLDITQADVDAFLAWWLPVFENRRVSEARILITAPFLTVRGRDLVPANRVALIDGWGCTVIEQTFLRTETTSSYVQDVESIEKAIRTYIEKYPEFTDCKIQNNDTTKGEPHARAKA